MGVICNTMDSTALKYKFAAALRYLLKLEKRQMLLDKNDRMNKVNLGNMYNFFDINRELFLFYKIVNFSYKISFSKRNSILIQDHHNNNARTILNNIIYQHGEYELKSSDLKGFIDYCVLRKNKNITSELIKKIGKLISIKNKYSLPEYNKIILLYLNYYNFKILFDINPPKMVCNVMDYSPFILGASLSANKKNILVVTTQMSLLSFAKSPYDVNVAIVKSKNAYKYYSEKSNIAYILDSKIKKNFYVRKVEGEKFVVGILLNNFFKENMVLSSLEKIFDKFDDCEVFLRFHPGTIENRKSKIKNYFQSNIQICSNSIDMKSFCDKCSFIVAGHTTSITEALQNKCPVIFSPVAFDLYAKSSKIVFSSKIEDIDIEDMNKYYSCKQWKNSFIENFNVENEISLKALSKLLNKILRN